MAKKKRNYRAEEAHRRNLEQARIREQNARQKAFWQANGKKILIAAAAAIVLIVAIWLGCKWFVGPGGSIPNWFGTLRNVEENWIVQNLGDSRSPRYYKLGEFDAPEGYTRDPEYLISGDKLNQNFYYAADDENALIKSVYAGGVKNMTAEQQIAILSSNSMFTEAGESTVVDMAGHKVHYVYLVTPTSPEGTPEEEQKGCASLYMYINTVQNTSVVMMLNTAEALMADVVPQDAIMAEAEQFVSLLTLEK